MGAFLGFQNLLEIISKDFVIATPQIRDYNVHWFETIEKFKSTKNTICSECWCNYLAAIDSCLYSPYGLYRMMSLTNESHDYFDSIPLLVPKVKSEKEIRNHVIANRKTTKIELINHSINGPEVLVFGDSFSISLLKFYHEYFSKVTFIRGSYRQRLVERYNPDLIIDIHIERNMYPEFLM